MFHPDTHALIDLWTALSRAAGPRATLPDRASLRPDALGARLTRVFMAERLGDDARMRLAGDWLEAFHDQPLTGVGLLSLWRSPSQAMVAAALRQTVRECRPVVVVAAVGVGNPPVEVTLAPFRKGPAGDEHILGLYAPTATLTLATHTAHRLTARVSMAVGDALRPSLVLAAIDGRRIA